MPGQNGVSAAECAMQSLPTPRDLCNRASTGAQVGKEGRVVVIRFIGQGKPSYTHLKMLSFREAWVFPSDIDLAACCAVLLHSQDGVWSQAWPPTFNFTLPAFLHTAAACRVPGLMWREVRCAADVTAVLREGWRARATAATALNAASSRSHAVLCVKVRGARDGQPFTSLLYLVDLAGKPAGVVCARKTLTVSTVCVCCQVPVWDYKACRASLDQEDRDVGGESKHVHLQFSYQVDHCRTPPQVTPVCGSSSKSVPPHCRSDPITATARSVAGECTSNPVLACADMYPRF